MKLLELYSLATGLKIRKQHLLEQFYPLPFTRFAVLHASSGMGSKNYSYFAEVVSLIKPFLVERGIEIVQVGIKDDPAVAGCYHTMGKTSEHQANYLVTRAEILLTNDSAWGHRAGHLGIPIVELFGPTTDSEHGPLDYNKEKTRFLVSHRWGRNPTYAGQENPKSVDLICPFSVARAVLELLEIPNSLTQSTLNIGSAFNATMLELVPNIVPDISFNPGIPMVARMDLEHNESILAQVFQTGRKLNILTKSPIALNILTAFKASILSMSYEIDETTPLDYVAALKKLIPATTFFTRSTDASFISSLRFKFFDIITIQQASDKTRADFEKACKEYTNNASFSLDAALNSGKLEIKSNKFVLSQGKIYLSHAHAKADLPVGAAGGNKFLDDKFLDDELIYCDMNHYLVYASS
jgi:hypothetical protein